MVCVFFWTLGFPPLLQQSIARPYNLVDPDFVLDLLYYGTMVYYYGRSFGNVFAAYVGGLSSNHSRIWPLLPNTAFRTESLGSFWRDVCQVSWRKIYPGAFMGFSILQELTTSKTVVHKSYLSSTFPSSFQNAVAHKSYLSWNVYLNITIFFTVQVGRVVWSGSLRITAPLTVLAWIPLSLLVRLNLEEGLCFSSVTPGFSILGIYDCPP